MLFFPIFIVSLVWSAGLFSYYKLTSDILYFHFAVTFIFFFAMSLIVYNIIFKNTNKTYELSILPFKAIKLSVVIMIFGLTLAASIHMYYTLMHSKSMGYDLARFYTRSLPFLGFLSRVEYWFPIILGPILAYFLSVLRSRGNLVFTLVILLLFVEISSGSKAGVIWYFLSFASGFILFVNNDNQYYKKIKNKIVILSIISPMLLLSTFYIYGDGTLESTLSGLMYRTSFGAIEGTIYTQDYYNEHKSSFPFFSIEKPIYTFLSTFRILDKDALSSVDTGVYLARYFGRDNDMASWTISWVGLSYLEGGYLGVLFGGGIFLLLYGLLLILIRRAKNQLTASLYISLLIAYAHFLDWGWIDGILVYSILYLIFAYFLLFFMSYVLYPFLLIVGKCKV